METATPPIDPRHVLIVIPMLNEERHAERVLRQLLDFDELSRSCTVIVADGGSEDRTREIVVGLLPEYPNVRLIQNPRRLQAAALNLALAPEFSEIEILIRCDAHALYPPGYASGLVRSILDRDAASVVVPMDTVTGSGCFERGLAWVADTWLATGGSPHRGGRRSGYVPHGHHAAFRMQMFREVGGYDETFVANEDAEYDVRVTEAGGRIWLDAGTRIGYCPRSSPVSLWQQYWRYGAGRARTHLKHRVRPRPRQILPVVNAALVSGSLLALPFAPLAPVWPAVYLSVVSAAGVATAVRRRSMCGLAAAPALAIMHIAWGLGFLHAALSRAPEVRQPIRAGSFP